jgi:hypothetical protein
VSATPERDDGLLAEHFERLDPGAAQIARIRHGLHAELEGHHQSLLDAWLALLADGPATAGGWLVAATLVMLLSSPAGALLRALMTL